MVTKEEYLRLIEEAIHQEEDYLEDIDCKAWIPAEPAIKKKIPERFGSIDATKLKREAIKKVIAHCPCITVSKFLIMLSTCEGNNDISSIDDANKQLYYSIRIFETKYHTPSGRPCNMQYKVYLSKDIRFENRPWLKFFLGSTALKVPEETLLDIIRWLQAITKLSSFL